ncbi:MAG: AbrB/MazE/SpoVT family DNA-binding domain-containing protein [Opitutaceae bacterium]|jgi:bifunctional DNA-binding transcriptional regulator/antitoxin component of YhaV-PrlF toxin-antitoxin module
MTTLTLTAKRQATLPVETCKSLGLKPGDVVELEARDEANGRVWVLRPRPARARRWIGSLQSFVRPVADHSLEAVRKSIAAGRKREGAA